MNDLQETLSFDTIEPYTERTLKKQSYGLYKLQNQKVSGLMAPTLFNLYFLIIRIDHLDPDPITWKFMNKAGSRGASPRYARVPESDQSSIFKWFQYILQLFYVISI